MPSKYEIPLLEYLHYYRPRAERRLVQILAAELGQSRKKRRRRAAPPSKTETEARVCA